MEGYLDFFCTYWECLVTFCIFSKEGEKIVIALILSLEVRTSMLLRPCTLSVTVKVK